MEVTLMHYTPLDVCSHAIRTCWNSFDKSDNGGEKDKALIDRVGNKYKHSSTLEHLSVSFYIQGISRACYSSDTEVLTYNGWKLFKEVNIDKDRFATRNNNGDVEFQKATDSISYYYKGDMHHYKRQTIDLLVTPNHRMLFKRSKGDVRKNKEDIYYLPSEDIKYKRVRFIKSFNFKQNSSLVFDIPSVTYERRNKAGTHKVTKTFTVKDKKTMLKFLTAYLSDGVTTYSKTENKYVITIYTPYIDKQNKILNWCSKLGINAHIQANKKSVRFTNYALGKWLKLLGTAKDKYLPFNPFDLSHEEADIFINTYLMFDGSINHKTQQGSLYTGSKRLADDLYNIALIAGYTPNMYIVDKRGENIVINNISTRVNLIAYQIAISFIGHKNREPEIGGRYPLYTTENYNDFVYCVTVPNGNLFVRRQNTGNACWCGNCLQEIVRHRISSFSVKSTRYTLKELKNIEPFREDDYKRANKFIVLTGNEQVDSASIKALNNLQAILKSGVSNDIAKYALPESYKTELTWSINARSLQNFLELRTSKSALWEIRDLANMIYNNLPKEHQYLFKDCINSSS